MYDDPLASSCFLRILATIFLWEPWCIGACLFFHASFLCEVCETPRHDLLVLEVINREGIPKAEVDCERLLLQLGMPSGRSNPSPDRLGCLADGTQTSWVVGKLIARRGGWLGRHVVPPPGFPIRVRDRALVSCCCACDHAHIPLLQGVVTSQLTWTAWMPVDVSEAIVLPLGVK